MINDFSVSYVLLHCFENIRSVRKELPSYDMTSMGKGMLCRHLRSSHRRAYTGTSRCENGEVYRQTTAGERECCAEVFVLRTAGRTRVRPGAKTERYIGRRQPGRGDAVQTSSFFAPPGVQAYVQVRKRRGMPADDSPQSYSSSKAPVYS